MCRLGERAGRSRGGFGDVGELSVPDPLLGHCIFFAPSVVDAPLAALSGRPDTCSGRYRMFDRPKFEKTIRVRRRVPLSFGGAAPVGYQNDARLSSEPLNPSRVCFVLSPRRPARRASSPRPLAARTLRGSFQPIWYSKGPALPSLCGAYGRAGRPEHDPISLKRTI